MSTERVPLTTICAYGYIRNYFTKTQLNVPVDIDIACICAQYLEPGLKWIFSVRNMDEKIIIDTHKESDYGTKTIKLLDNEDDMKWESLTPSDQRLMQNIICSSETNLYLTEIECTSTSFGIDGARWISSMLNHPSHSLQYINLPECNLNGESVQIIIDSLAQNQSLHNPLYVISPCDLSL